MRFRFCGDLDCPDWVLAEMNSLSRLTSVKMKLLCQEVVKSLAGAPLDPPSSEEEDIHEYEYILLFRRRWLRPSKYQNSNYEAVKKLTADAKYDESDREGAVAALSFVIRGSVRHGLLAGGERGEGEEAMVLELTQLGLPRELAKAIAKAAAGGANQLRKHFRDSSLRLNHLVSAAWGPSDQGGDMNPDVNGAQRLKLKVKGPTTWDGPTDAVTSHEIILTPIIVPTLLQDLKRVLSRMEEM